MESSLFTYHLDSWNNTGSSSNGNLLRRNSSLLPLEHHPSASPTADHYPTVGTVKHTRFITNPMKPSSQSAVNLLNSNQPQPTTRCKRSLLPFLGTALSWLTGTATTKDIHSIRTRINLIIATQSLQCHTLVHIVSILNVTRYATQVNRHSINSLMDAVHSAAQDIDNLFNVTSSLCIQHQL